MNTETPRSGIFPLLLLLLLLADSAAFAQEAAADTAAADTAEPDGAPAEAGTESAAPEGQFTFVDRSGDEIKMMQHLSWIGDEAASGYEVSIEQKQEDGIYVEIIRQQTQDRFIDVNLTPGLYRYRVQAFDLLNRAWGNPPWIDFEVLLALQPAVSSFNKDGFFLDEDTDWDLTVRGSNFVAPTERAGSEIYLRPQETERNKSALKPARLDIKSPGSAELNFDMRTLVPGKYDVYVQNPGGLDSALGTFTIAYRKPFDFNVSLDYMPGVPTNGDLYEFFNAPFNFAGAAVRAGFIFFKRPWGYMGVELAPSFVFMEMKKDGYTVTFQEFNFIANYVYQFYFNKRMFAVSARIGAGLTMINNMQFDFGAGDRSETFSGFMPALDAGVSFIWFVHRPVFLEAGLDFIQSFSFSDAAMPGRLRPYIGVGWQF